MLQTVRAVSGFVGGASGCLSALLAFYLALFPPTNDGAKVAFLGVAGFAAVLALSGFAIFAVCEQLRDNQRDLRDEARDRNVADIMEKLEIATAKVNPHEIARPLLQETNDPAAAKLRDTVLRVTKEMRYFLSHYDGDRADLLVEFWDEFPFRSYDALKERMKNSLGRFNVQPASEWLPNTPEAIARLSNSLESDALKISPDVPL